MSSHITGFQASSAPPSTLSQRINSIDMMRGLVMLIMLLDHVRERFFLQYQVSDPMDIGSTDPALFFSRLAAHWCAPVFVCLAGVSAFLYQQQGRSLTPFLLKRGLVLIALEVIVINVAWMGHYHTLWLQVIWAIGMSMLVLAALHRLPRPLIWLLAITIIAGHNLLTPIRFTPDEWGYTLWAILHDRGYIWQGQLSLLGDYAFAIKASYPLLPWFGVILLGYAMGPWFLPDKTSAGSSSLLSRRLCLAGGIALGLLLILRSVNQYGEPVAWQWHDRGLQTVMSWFNFTKYPPSLDFLLLTLGLMCFALVGFSRLSGAAEKPASALPSHAFSRGARTTAAQSRARIALGAWLAMLQAYGGAPMFFYILHLYVLLLLHKTLSWWQSTSGVGSAEGYAMSHIGQIWLCSLVLAVLLYWPTRAFAAFKRRSGWRWLRYL
jgi:uncharacterized membrane protein